MPGLTFAKIGELAAKLLKRAPKPPKLPFHPRVPIANAPLPQNPNPGFIGFGEYTPEWDERGELDLRFLPPNPPGLPPPAALGTVPGTAATNGKPQNPELVAALARAEDARGRMTPDIDPVEAGLAAIAGQGLTMPGTMSRVAAIPGQFADQRAELAGQEYRTEQGLIGDIRNREAMAEKVEAQIRLGEMRGKVQTTIAQLRNNTALIKELGKLAGTGQLTMPAVSAVFSQMAESQEEADELARRFFEQYERNPSLRVQIDQAKVQATQEAGANKKLADLRGMLKQRGKLTAFERFGVYQDLREAGDPAYQLDDLQLMSMAKQLSEMDTAIIEEKGENVRYKKRLGEQVTAKIGEIAANRKLKDAQRTKIEKEVSVFDEVHQEKMARSKGDLEVKWAQVENSSRRISQAERSSIRATLNNSLSTITQQINDIEGRIEKKRELIEILKSNLKKGEKLPQVHLDEYNDLVERLHGNPQDPQAPPGLIQQYAEMAHKKNQIEATADTGAPATGRSKYARDKDGNLVPKAEGGGPKAQRASEAKQRFLQVFPGSPNPEQFGPGSFAGSLHKEGAALDLRGINLQAKADWATKQPGVQLVVYNRKQWTPSRGWHDYPPKFKDGKPTNPHTDHVHMDWGRTG